MIRTQTNVYDSSTVESSSYIYETKELFVNFKFGAYKYIDVSLEDYIRFSTSKSQGISLNEVIKSTYKYKKIEEI